MLKTTLITLAALALGLAQPISATAMDIEVRSPFVILSGSVTGIELRILKDALEKNPEITTVVLRNSRGGDARTGYAVGEYLREKGLNTAVSGYCRSSCSRMFLGGKVRSFSDDQPLEKTYVAFHGNYASDGRLMSSRMSMLKDWVIQYSDGKANPQFVTQWVNLENRNGFAYFYHPQAELDLGPQRVMFCQGNEDPKTRVRDCVKPELGDALSNGIVTTLEILKMGKPIEGGKP